MGLSDQEIKELILKVQAGNKEAFAQIYDLFFERISKYIFFRTKQREEAEDLTSLVFLKVWQNIGKYKIQKSAKFSTWLFQVARFTLIDYYRQRKPQVSLAEMKEIGELGSLEKNVELEEIKKYMQKLPEHYQTVIALRYFEDLDYKQIAHIMGRTSLGVRVLLHRAVKKLSALMKIDYEKK
jgi:RNA polymerase sigma-70 factor (ECF subfamily)